MTTAVNRFFRTRFAVPVLIGFVFLLALIGEITYRRAETTLTGGINLTDARIGSAKLLQLLTDAETAQRGYLLTGNAAYLEPLHNAQKEFNQGIGFLDFMGSLGASGQQDAANIRGIVASKFAELERTVALAQAGNQIQAIALVQTDSGKQLMDQLRTIFKTRLEESVRLQQVARDRIYTALFFNRMAVLGLCCMLALGLYLHMRQLRVQNRERLGYQQTLEKEVAHKTLGLRTLAAWLETAREDEKAHLARELHDELGGILTAAKLTLARAKNKLAGHDEVLLLINSVSQRLSEGIALKRQIIEDLRPSTLSMLGLKVALETLCAEAEQTLKIVLVQDIAPMQLAAGAELALFRVAQEALTNIGKYAQATQVAVRLRQTPECVRLEIQDNGAGFELERVEPGRHGLAGMRFRLESHGGALSIVSAPLQGVQLIAQLPLSTIVTPDHARDADLAALALSTTSPSIV